MPKAPAPKPFQATVEIAQISETPSESNPNLLSDADFTGLCEAVRRLDFAQAITLRQLPGGGFDIIDGNHRLRAARVAGLSELPALVYPETLSDAHLRALRNALNRWRGDPKPSVVADDLKFLAAEGWDRADLFAASGWDQQDLDLLFGVRADEQTASNVDLSGIPGPDPGSAGESRSERIEDRPAVEIACSSSTGKRELVTLIGRVAKQEGFRGKYRMEAAVKAALRRMLGED